jgi:hypothetical protein
VIPVSVSGFVVIAQERCTADRRLDQLDSVKDPYWVAQLIMDQTVITPGRLKLGLTRRQSAPPFLVVAADLIWID